MTGDIIDSNYKPGWARSEDFSLEQTKRSLSRLIALRPASGFWSSDGAFRPKEWSVTGAADNYTTYSAAEKNACLERLEVHAECCFQRAGVQSTDRCVEASGNLIVVLVHRGLCGAGQIDQRLY